ncbi:MAG: alpha/beta hydrolase [Woeseia sp.]|jgi:arylformamidase|nr:alpha/beta hydrolase [Woeseia sp.]MBT6211317.1 alpha/beta hydrolase [Woeseia sp.]
MTKIYANFDQTELDREYSPSSCVDDINLFLNEYVRLSHAAKKSALAIDRCEIDLRYGVSDEETLDLFLPDESASAPLHIFIHGGYWQALSKNESCFAANTFQGNGHYFAALNYTLAPQKSLSGIVEEVCHAIAWLYTQAAKFGFDRDRIYLSGSSAGAHLAMMMLQTDWSEFDLPNDAIKGVCAISGIYDLQPIQLTYVNDVVQMDAQEALRNSPALHPIRNPCPVILCYGDNETAEFKRQSDELLETLRMQNIPVSLQEIKNRNHFDIVFELLETTTWLSMQVQEQMQGT